MADAVNAHSIKCTIRNFCCCDKLTHISQNLINQLSAIEIPSLEPGDDWWNDGPRFHKFLRTEPENSYHFTSESDKILANIDIEEIVANAMNSTSESDKILLGINLELFNQSERRNDIVAFNELDLTTESDKALMALDLSAILSNSNKSALQPSDDHDEGVVYCEDTVDTSRSFICSSLVIPSSHHGDSTLEVSRSFHDEYSMLQSLNFSPICNREGSFNDPSSRSSTLNWTLMDGVMDSSDELRRNIREESSDDSNAVPLVRLLRQVDRDAGEQYGSSSSSSFVMQDDSETSDDKNTSTADVKMDTGDQESSDGNTLAPQTAGHYQGYNEEEGAARAGPSGLATNQPTSSRAPNEAVRQTRGSSSESQEAEVFRCDICAMEFLSARGLQLHRQADHENIRFKCTECGKIFKRRSDLLAHLKNHLGLLHQTCSDCGLVFKRPSTLGQHYNRVHLQMVTFHYCSKCGKRFKSRPSMKRHEKHCNNK